LGWQEKICRHQLFNWRVLPLDYANVRVRVLDLSGCFYPVLLSFVGQLCGGEVSDVDDVIFKVKVLFEVLRMDTAGTGKIIVGGVRGFFDGLFSVWMAFRFVISHPKLYKYVAIPFIINVVVFSVAVYWGFDFFTEVSGQYFSPQDAWYWQIVAVVVKFLAGLITLVVVFFAFTVVGNLIAAPFNDVLSQRTEQILTGTLIDEPFSMAQIMKDLWRVIQDELRKMSIFVVLMIVALLFNFLPGVGSFIYAVLSVGLTLYFLIIEYTGYVFGRKHLGFKDQRIFISRNRLGTLGFAVAVMGMLCIPFVQFFTIPIAVVAATQICCSDQG